MANLKILIKKNIFITLKLKKFYFNKLCILNTIIIFLIKLNQIYFFIYFN